MRGVRAYSGLGPVRLLVRHTSTPCRGQTLPFGFSAPTLVTQSARRQGHRSTQVRPVLCHAHALLGCFCWLLPSVLLTVLLNDNTCDSCLSVVWHRANTRAVVHLRRRTAHSLRCGYGRLCKVRVWPWQRNARRQRFVHVGVLREMCVRFSCILSLLCQPPSPPFFPLLLLLLLQCTPVHTPTSRITLLPHAPC
jgi:ribosomal protein L37E